MAEKRPQEADPNSGKRQKVEGENDQFSDLFNDPLPGFTSERNNTSNNDIDIDFDNLPANFLDPIENEGRADTHATPPVTVKQETSETSIPNQKPATYLSQPPYNPAPPAPVNSGSGPLTFTPTSFPQYNAALNANTGPNNSNINHSNININNNNNSSTMSTAHTDDTSKLNDAIAAAGVDIQREEDLLIQQQMNRRSDVSRDLKQYLKSSKALPFLNAYHTASFMNKVARENGVQQNFLQDGEMLDLVSSACENWIANVLTKTIILSRHRRRGIPLLNNNNNTNLKNKKGSSAAASTSNAPRSELSKELRNIAVKQKELEEKRVSKRIILGLEKSANDPSENPADAKAGAEETLHRAANATAAMMTMNPGRKKYSWMTSDASANDTAKSGADKEGKGKQSQLISARGDNGLRYREIRTGNLVTLKDLLGAIEDERMGTENAIIKGYAKLKD